MAQVKFTVMGGAAHTDTFSYAVCCTYGTANTWYLFSLLPLFLIMLCCAMCFIYVLSNAPKPMLDPDFGEERGE